MLQALSVLWTPHPLMREIQDWLYRLRARHKTMEFCGVPSHVGIPGNETIDAAAKVACTLTPMPLLLTHRDFYPILKCSLYERWQSEWKTKTTHLRFIKIDFF